MGAGGGPAYWTGSTRRGAGGRPRPDCVAPCRADRWPAARRAARRQPRHGLRPAAVVWNRPSQLLSVNLAGRPAANGLDRHAALAAFQVGDDLARLRRKDVGVVDPQHGFVGLRRAGALNDAAIAAQHPDLVAALLPAVGGLGRDDDGLRPLEVGQLDGRRGRGNQEDGQQRREQWSPAHGTAAPWRQHGAQGAGRFLPRIFQQTSILALSATRSSERPVGARQNEETTVLTQNARNRAGGL